MVLSKPAFASFSFIPSETGTSCKVDFRAHRDEEKEQSYKVLSE